MVSETNPAIESMDNNSSKLACLEGRDTRFRKRLS